PAERCVVVVVNQQPHVAEAQRLGASSQQHEHDGHQYGQQDQQLVAPEQPPLLDCLGQNLLHSGIADLRDSMSEINTSSSENSAGFQESTLTPALSSSAAASFCCASFSATRCSLSPKSDTRDAPNFFFRAVSARSGWSVSISESDPFIAALTSPGDPAA